MKAILLFITCIVSPVLCQIKTPNIRYNCKIPNAVGQTAPAILLTNNFATSTLGVPTNMVARYDTTNTQALLTNVRLGANNLSLWAVENAEYLIAMTVYLYGIAPNGITTDVFELWNLCPQLNNDASNCIENDVCNGSSLIDGASTLEYLVNRENNSVPLIDGGAASVYAQPAIFTSTSILLCMVEANKTSTTTQVNIALNASTSDCYSDAVQSIKATIIIGRHLTNKIKCPMKKVLINSNTTTCGSFEEFGVPITNANFAVLANCPKNGGCYRQNGTLSSNSTVGNLFRYTQPLPSAIVNSLLNDLQVTQKYVRFNQLYSGVDSITINWTYSIDTDSGLISQYTTSANVSYLNGGPSYTSYSESSVPNLLRYNLSGLPDTTLSSVSSRRRKLQETYEDYVDDSEQIIISGYNSTIIGASKRRKLGTVQVSGSVTSSGTNINSGSKAFDLVYNQQLPDQKYGKKELAAHDTATSLMTTPTEYGVKLVSS